MYFYNESLIFSLHSLHKYNKLYLKINQVIFQQPSSPSFKHMPAHDLPLSRPQHSMQPKSCISWPFIICYKNKHKS